jgi:hypothetical protein
MLARRTNPSSTGRIYDRNRFEGLWTTNYSCDNREESIYGLLEHLQWTTDSTTMKFEDVSDLGVS